MYLGLKNSLVDEDNFFEMFSLRSSCQGPPKLNTQLSCCEQKGYLAADQKNVYVLATRTTQLRYFTTPVLGWLLQLPILVLRYNTSQKRSISCHFLCLSFSQKLHNSFPLARVSTADINTYHSSSELSLVLLFVDTRSSSFTVTIYIFCCDVSSRLYDLTA